MGVKGGFGFSVFWSRGRFEESVKIFSGKFPIAAAFAGGDMYSDRSSAMIGLGLPDGGSGGGVLGAEKNTAEVADLYLWEKDRRNEEEFQKSAASIQSGLETAKGYMT
jgi:hypothetical protein